MYKYKSDGHCVTPTAEAIKNGTVLRTVEEDGGVSPFSDMVVISIWYETKNGDRRSCDHLRQALSKVNAEWGLDYSYKIRVECARPAVYASTGDCLMGIEKCTLYPDRILKNNYIKVVEMITGEVASWVKP